MLEKTDFIKAMKGLKAQWVHDRKATESFRKIFMDTFLASYNTSFAMEACLSVLKTCMCDNHKDSWIDYFIYELDFGKEWEPGMVTNADGTDIDLSTLGKLYDFLIKNI